MSTPSSHHRNPAPTVDIIIEHEGGLILIERRNPPLGWALPGGFVDEGESLEQAAMREALEETGLQVTLLELLYVYSSPDRDPRRHTVSTVFVARGNGVLQAGDDAGQARVLQPGEPLQDLVFDHAQILSDYQRWKSSGQRPSPQEMLHRIQ